jgi:hypothetical protein
MILKNSKQEEFSDMAKRQGWKINGCNVIGENGHFSANNVGYPYDGVVDGKSQHFISIEEATRKVGLNYDSTLEPIRVLSEEEVESEKRKDEAFERKQTRMLQKNYNGQGRTVPEESEMRLRGTMTSE